MKLSNIMSVAGRNLSVAKLKISKHSPELLLIAGIAGGVASAVMACKATTKVSEILDKTSEDIASIHQVEENPPMGSDYSHEDILLNAGNIFGQENISQFPGIGLFLGLGRALNHFLGFGLFFHLTIFKCMAVIGHIVFCHQLTPFRKSISDVK